MSKVYVVVQIDWEYNDEGYNTSENEGSHPIKAYSSRELAGQEVLNMTTDLVNTKWDFISDCGDSYENRDDLSEYLTEIGAPLVEEKNSWRTESKPSRKLHANEVQRVLSISGTSFFKVVEVDLVSG